MAKEYIEREAVLKKQRTLTEYDEGGWDAKVAVVEVDDIKDIPAADVVEVVRPDEAVLSEFEDDYKDFKKIKTHIAQIIVGGKVEEPYYSILWWDEKCKEYMIGYSSYCLDYVRKWLELVFEVVEETDVVEVVRCKDCIHWLNEEGLDDHVCLKIYSDGAVSQFAWQHREPNDFCSYGERRDGGADE